MACSRDRRDKVFRYHSPRISNTHSTTYVKIILLLVYFPALTIDAVKSNNATFDVDLTFDDYEVTNGTKLEENVVYPSGSRSPKPKSLKKRFRSSKTVKMEDTGSLSDKNIVNGKDAKLGMVRS